MKKLFTLLLAVLMIATMSVTAFAAETNNGTEDTTINVNAIYSDNVTTKDVISVDVAWGAMEFTYSVGGTKTWDPAKHEYITDTSASWSANGNTVTVTNHSNVAINANLTFDVESAYQGLTGSFGEKATISLDSAVETSYAEAPTDTATLALSGELPESVNTLTQVGTITVKISKQ